MCETLFKVIISATNLLSNSLHRLLLDDLGVKQVAAVVGGSMGGMLVLEWAYFGKEFIRSIVPIATSSQHSAWGISWGEAQRQSIYADPKYNDGYYSHEDPPTTGLGAARMSALLTYRSRNSFEKRFGRNIPDATKKQTIGGSAGGTGGGNSFGSVGNGSAGVCATVAAARRLGTPSEAHFHIHNDGHKLVGSSRTSRSNSSVNIGAGVPVLTTSVLVSEEAAPDPQFHGPASIGVTTPTPTETTTTKGTTSIGHSSLTGGDGPPSTSTYFSAQSYLRYQGQKFVKRFDPNCYIAITRKLDTHDLSRGRAATISEALAAIEQPTLVLGIESDGLFNFAEQQELAEHIPNARLGRIDSPEGHDAFLLQFEQVNAQVLEFFREVLPDIIQSEGHAPVEASVGVMTQSSTFGEAEVEDITAW